MARAKVVVSLKFTSGVYGVYDYMKLLSHGRHKLGEIQLLIEY